MRQAAKAALAILAASSASALLILNGRCSGGGPPQPAAVSREPAPTGAETPAAAPQVRFVNVAREAGLVLQNVSGEVSKDTINETVGNGVCLEDVDGDGLLDVFIPNGWRTRPFPPPSANGAKSCAWPSLLSR